MDMLNRVSELSPHDAADRVDTYKARNALQREIARAERRGSRRLGLALGAGGSVAAVAAAVAVGVVIGGAGTVVSAVAPPAVAPAEAASAAEVLKTVAVRMEEAPVEIPAGSYLKADAHWLMLNTVNPSAPSYWEGGFSRVRTGATGATLVDLQHTAYKPAEGEDVTTAIVAKHPVQSFGDEAAVAATWNTGDLAGTGDYAALRGTPPPATVSVLDATARQARDMFTSSMYESPLTPEERQSLNGEAETDPQAMVDAAVADAADGSAGHDAARLQIRVDKLQRVLDTGEIPADAYGHGWMIDPDTRIATEVPVADGKPQTLDDATRADVTAVLASVRAELERTQAQHAAAEAAMAAWSPDERAARVREAIGDLIVSTQSADFALASPERRATVLRAIALSPDLTVESEDGSLQTLTFAGSDGTLKMKIDTAASQVLEVSSYLTRQRNVASDDPLDRSKWTYTDIGSSSLVPADLPDERYTLTTEIVTEVPAPTE